MSKGVGRHPEKNHQNLSLHINYQNKNPEQIRVVSLKVDIYDLRLIKNIGIEDLTPYFVVTIGKDIQQTGIPKDRNENYFVYYDVLEFKNVKEEKLSIAIYHKKSLFHKDKILGGNSIDLKYTNNFNSIKLEILNYQHEVIATSDMRITQIDSSYKYPDEEKKHRKNLTDNAIPHFQNIPSMPASIGLIDVLQNNFKDLSNDLINKINSVERKSVIEEAKDKKILKKQMSKENLPIHTPSEKKNQSSTKKSKKSIEFLDLESNIITLEDIERIKFDLNQEKNKIRTQETKLNKLIRKFKLMEAEMEDEKKRAQARKDHLTQQELAVLEERKKFESLVQLLNLEKEEQKKIKEGILGELEAVRHSTILQKSKNQILFNKLASVVKKNDELENRTIYMKHKASEKNQLKAHFNSERFGENNLNSLFSENTEVFKTHHKKDSFSVIGSHELDTLNESEHKKTINKENLILQIKLEKNRCETLEKELQDLNTLEAYLTKETRKCDSSSRSRLKRMLPTNNNLPIQTPNNTLRFVKNVSASVSFDTHEIENKDVSISQNFLINQNKLKMGSIGGQKSTYTPKPLSVNNSMYSFDISDLRRRVTTEQGDYFSYNS